MTLVDTNVLIDVVGDDPIWYDWSVRQIDDAILRGPIFINDVIYAEASVRYASVSQFEDALIRAGLTVVPTPREALFIAGKAFAKYRHGGGLRTGVLPDFFIGAHAAVTGLPLLTRDARRYRNYFPAIELIAPDAN